MEKSNSEKDNCAYKKFLEEGTTKFYQNDFIGAIDALNKAIRLGCNDKYANMESVCIYLTDGYGAFPSKEPDLPVLWVVLPGGASKNFLPFVDIVRLNS